MPSGEFDIGLVVQDRQFDRNGFLVYDTFDHNGFLGDKFVVNGIIQPFLKVARRKYRFRFLNGSNARFFELSLSNGQPFVAIATDSSLLPRPVTVRVRDEYNASHPWVELQRDLPFEGTPVLADAEFERASEEIRAITREAGQPVLA